MSKLAFSQRVASSNFLGLGLGLWLGAVTLGGLTLSPTAAFAQVPPGQAEASTLNDQGKAFMQDQNYAAASDRFRQAIQLSPEGRFYFNLCVSLYQEARFHDSLTACAAVNQTTGDEALRTKAAKMSDKIKTVMREQGYDPDAPPPNPNVGTGDPANPGNPTGTGDPANPGNPTGTGDPANPANPAGIGTGTGPQGQAPANVFMPGPSAHDYRWSVGGDLAIGSLSADGGSVTSIGIRGHASFLTSPSRMFGVHASIAGYTLSDDLDNTLSLYDVGAGAFKHFCTKKLCITPKLNIHIGSLGEGENQPTILGLGGAVDVGYAFGAKNEHVISAAADFTAYTKARVGNVDVFPASQMMTLNLGYTRRFSTAFGSGPFITLE